jgi:integrase
LGATLKTHRAQQAQEQLFLGAAYKKGDLVFAQPDGTPVYPSIFGESFKNLIERMKVTQISLHGLRDTHASLLAKAGVPIEVISRRLGHSSINITMDRYMHVYRERDEDAASAFDKFVS